MSKATDLEWINKNLIWLLPFLVIFSRIMFFLSFMPYAYYGYGDIPIYFDWTSLDGWPFIDYWVEYPPLFPFISEVLYRFAGGNKYFYVFYLALVISFACAGAVVVFQKLSNRLYGKEIGLIKTLLFFVLLIIHPYTWWYAEPITVFLFITALYASMTKYNWLSGLWIGIGVLSKWFPLFIIPSIGRYFPIKKSISIVVFAIFIPVLTFGVLYLISPDMTLASLLSQPNRTSWQTIWALIDGNFTTGAFLTTEDRLNPDVARIPTGFPAVIPTRITLLIFAVIGLWLWSRWNNRSEISFVAFTGVSWNLFLLWSPGWSPQWIFYIIPLTILILPISSGLLWSLLLIIITNFEWPLLLMSNTFEALYIIVPLRILIFIFLLREFYKFCHVKG